MTIDKCETYCTVHMYVLAWAYVLACAYDNVIMCAYDVHVCTWYARVCMCVCAKQTKQTANTAKMSHAPPLRIRVVAYEEQLSPLPHECPRASNGRNHHLIKLDRIRVNSSIASSIKASSIKASFSQYSSSTLTTCSQKCCHLSGVDTAKPSGTKDSIKSKISGIVPTITFYYSPSKLNRIELAMRNR